MDSRKEIIKKYKQTVTPMGVYQVKNLIDGTIYLGSSLNLDAIKNRHFMEFRLFGHSVKELQKAYSEFGEKCISFEILDRLEPKEDPAYDYKADISTLEDLWFEKLSDQKDIKLCRLRGTMLIKPKKA
ncbi:MAG: GIY-YIG nuclease family protein [Ignavibacteria bacterium]